MWVALLAVLCAGRGAGAALTEFPDFWYLETFNNDAEEHSSLSHAHAPQEPPPPPAARALDLPLAGDAVFLRVADDEEARMVRDVLEPIQLIAMQRVAGGGAGVPRDRPREAAPRRPPPAPRAGDVAEIRRLVNKFVVSAPAQRGQALGDGDASEPTVTVYLLGASGLLVVRCEQREWNFVLRPPAPLPAWLRGAPVVAGHASPLPAPVQAELYATLLRLMRVFFKFDL